MSQSVLGDVPATNSDQRLWLLARPWSRRSARRGVPGRQSRSPMTAPSRVFRLRALSRATTGLRPGLLHRVAAALHARRVGTVVSFLALRILVRPATGRAAQTADGRADRGAPARAAAGRRADRRPRRGAADCADHRADRRALAGLGRGIEAGLLLRPRLALAAVTCL